ncbi:Uncharacterised protein [Candidatus Ornithobacterium hominis]|uniref:Uncharacterized protein n=1 Tax=Candidatus Ornithobacterium hominis TaxID=2497989 RepID=A0A383U415_9FLAO|nr:hypothetical protein [Candidatus Ornithobacterium hominis]MCT7905118.1 hypothetical protein [Candidatus Ornithobacterium hominis]SZD74218.1 Uncharacterised protein [Candidatus Ornithobacterium hominis]
MKYIFLNLLIFFPFSCFNSNEKIKIHKGRVDVVINAYKNAQKGLNDVKSFHLTSLNFVGDTIIEIVPDLDIPELETNVFFSVNDSSYRSLPLKSWTKIDFKSLKQIPEKSLSKKKEGFIYNSEIEGFDKRIEIADTVLLGKSYKRFDIEDDKTFARYYIYQTDSVYPFTINKKIENTYHGRIERIDTYDKVNDLFIATQVIFNKKISADVAELFEYNDYLKEN